MKTNKEYLLEHVKAHGLSDYRNYEHHEYYGTRRISTLNKVWGYQINNIFITNTGDLYEFRVIIKLNDDLSNRPHLLEIIKEKILRDELEEILPKKVNMEKKAKVKV